MHILKWPLFQLFLWPYFRLLYTPEAGKLASAITEKDIARITHLTVEGKINAEDFEVMHRDMHSLSHLNLKNCDIEAIDGFDADKIPDMAFSHYIGHDKDGYEKYIGKRTLRQVILPESATVIGKRAFRSVKKLQKIELPKSLFCICDEAFQECKRLDCDLEFAQSLKSIGEFAFLGCHALSCELIFPDGLKNIGSCAFQYCTNISAIVLPKSNCKIGMAAFSSCEYAYAHLVIPQGSEKIELLAFNECQAIKSVEIPATCREIGDHAFGEPIFLEKVIIHATTPPKLGKKSFLHQGVQADLYVPEGCYEEYAASDWSVQFHYITEHTITIELVEAGSLDAMLTNHIKSRRERIILKGRMDERDFRTLRTQFQNLTHVDLRACEIEGNCLPTNAFLNCKTLVEVLLPDNIIAVGDAAFCGCQELRTLHFSGALREVGDMAFYGCKALSEVEFDSTTTPKFGLKVFKDIERSICVVPNGCSESYDNAIYLGLNASTYMIERTIIIKGNKRWSAHELISYDEAKHVTHIIAEGNIDYRDFAYIRDNCHNLEELDLREATIVKHKHHEANIIPENALCVTCYDLFFELYGMGKLKKVILPEGIITIGKYAFGDGVEVITAEDYCPF